MYKVYMFIPKKLVAHFCSSWRPFIPFLKVDEGLLEATSLVVLPYQVNCVYDTEVIGAETPHYVSSRHRLLDDRNTYARF